MRLREIKYQMSVKLKSLLPVFHKSHYENLIWMVVGMVYSRSVSLPKVAESAPVNQIQLESRVERFERRLSDFSFNSQFAIRNSFAVCQAGSADGVEAGGHHGVEASESLWAADDLDGSDDD